MEIVNDAQWINGLDSISYTLGVGSYQWAQNVVNRGGMLQTRQGLAEIAAVAQKDPRGCGVITISGVTWMLAAIGENIYKLNLNNSSLGLQILNYPKVHTTDPDVPVKFPVGNRRSVHFELCVRAQKSVKVGTGYNTVQVTPPQFVLIIQDGTTDPHYWDGVKCDKIDNHPDAKDTKPNNTPKAQYMKWAGDRLWTISGRKVRASNLLNPFQNTEELITASGGFFFLPDNVTGVGITHDYKSLLVYTHFTTSAFQAGIEDRTAWPNTQDFQRVIFPSIGCVAHRTITNMYGMTWWMSQDGWVGLDNTLSAYQSSRLDVQDQNMSRSKDGINWSSGGGCAGTFGNFLFVSVPSASKWNQHTWVMDQAPINTLAGVAPPAWAANWTGIRPEQWVTCQVGGQQRCFCISRDLTNEGHQSTVWEAYIGQRMDVPKVGGVRKAKDIGCAVESRFIGLSPSQYARLRWIEVDCAEIIGDVQLQVYYCGRRTSYKRILDTHLTGTVSPGVEEIFNDEGIPVYVPQYRTVRSFTDVHSDDDNDTEIQTPLLRNIDREFSALVMWSGQMAVSAIRFALDPESDDMEGRDHVSEYLARRITAEGDGSIGCTLPPVNAPTNAVTSKFLAPIKPRWVEFPAYDSAVPNGVFFVAELQANPPPGAYPSGLYPIDVTLTSETEGIDIYYTRDGSKPKPPPNQHGTHYPPRPEISLNQRLRALGAREGMQNSVELNGRYTQSQVAEVVFDPPAGDFPPDEFADPTPPPDLAPKVSYNFNEGTGGVVHDSSGHDVSGTTQNTTWTTQGKHAKALNFNGTNGYVFLGNPQVLRLTGSATWSAWVKAIADPADDGAGVIISKANNIRGWSLMTIKVAGQQRFVVTVTSQDHVFITRASTTVRSLNTWYHVAGVYNAAAHTLDLYVDGVLDNGVLTGAVPAAQLDAHTNVNVGRLSAGGSLFNGIIDDVRVYGRAQTAAEIVVDKNTAVTTYVPPPEVAGFPVRMSTPTGEATIHYTTNHPGPVTQQHPEYDPANPPHPFANTTYRAKAFLDQYLPSDQTQALYHAVPRCRTPTCTPDEGGYPRSEYNPTKSIVVDTATDGAKLKYTINSDDFENDSHTINDDHGTVEVNINDTLRVKAFKAGMSDSLVKTATYTADQERVATPVLTPPIAILHGNVHEIDVRVECSTQNVTLYYEIMPIGEEVNPTHNSPHIDLGSGSTNIHLGPGQPGHIGHKKLRVLASRVDMDDSLIAEGQYEWEGPN